MLTKQPTPTLKHSIPLTLLLSIVFCISLSFFLSHPTQAQTLFETITPQNEKGFSYIQYKGEQTLKGKEILNIIEQQGCKLRVLWIPEQGIGYHTEAIGVADFVNKPFFEKALLKTDTKMTIQCIDNTRLNETIIQEPVSNITETHIHWFQYPKINTERNKQGEALIQYGGGSLYHLVGRLSTQGCNVHTLEIEDKETQRVYEYSFQNTNEQNQEFTDKYKEYIPNNTIIGISCIDNCDVIYGLDLVESEAGQYWIPRKEKCKDTDIIKSERLNENLVSHSLCGNNWSDKAREFFPHVPAFQDVCKIYAIVKAFDSYGVTFSSILIDQKAMYQAYVPTIYVAQHKDPQQQRTDIRILETELHELCHIHQDWYTFKEYIDHSYLRDNMGPDEQVWIEDLWYETPMAEEFNEIVGFQQSEDGTWKIQSNNPYRDIYSLRSYNYFTSDPKELSADLCGYYLLNTIQPNSEYKKHAQPPYITEEIKEWIETYIVLPE